jgi:hypothetical protein
MKKKRRTRTTNQAAAKWKRLVDDCITPISKSNSAASKTRRPAFVIGSPTNFTVDYQSRRSLFSIGLELVVSMVLACRFLLYVREGGDSDGGGVYYNRIPKRKRTHSTSLGIVASGGRFAHTKPKKL